MPNYDVAIEDLTPDELNEVVDTLARHAGGYALEKLTIRAA